MDFAKLASLFLTSLIAGFSILFNYKIKVRSDDPATGEQEKLSIIGKIALLVLVVASFFNIYSELQSQREKIAEKTKVAEQAKKEVLELQKRQEEQNRVSQGLINQMKENLILIKDIQQETQKVKEP